MFYNTGIATYIWLLTNRKAEEQKGKVQLIDATGWYQSLRKNMGKKNCELSETHIQDICRLVIQPEETEQSKIFPNEAFGYQKVIVERPLRLSVDLSGESLREFERLCRKEGETGLYSVAASVAERLGEGPHRDYNLFIKSLESQAKKMSVKLPAKSRNFLKKHLAKPDENAEPLIKKVYKPNKQAADPLYGFYEKTVNGKKAVVEYEPDTGLRDSEIVNILVTTQPCQMRLIYLI